MSLNQSQSSTNSSSLCTNPPCLVKKTQTQNSNPSASSHSRSSSKTESVTKYFQKKDRPENDPNCDSPCKEAKIICNDPASDDDFRSPMVLRKRNNLVWNLNKNPKQTKRSKKGHKKGKITKNSTIEIVKRNLDFAQVNPDNGDSNSKALSTEGCTPNISQIFQNVKFTSLERYGFKSDKATLCVQSRKIHGTSEPPKRVRNRFKYITPVLFIRSSKDRESLIASKMSVILNQPTRNMKTRTSHTSLTSTKLQDMVVSGEVPRNHSVFQLDNIYQSKYFYIENLNLPKDNNNCKCGSMLKDWSSIVGRDKSPERTPNKLTEAIELSASVATANPNSSNNNKGSEFVNNINKPTLSFDSSSLRSISPDLFGSDDEVFYDNLNKGDESRVSGKLMDDNNCSKKTNSSDLDKQGDSMPHPNTIDLTDDDSEPLNNNNSSNSFTKPASFYSLEEFEDEKANAANVTDWADDGGSNPPSLNTTFKNMCRISTSQACGESGEYSKNSHTTLEKDHSFTYVEELDDDVSSGSLFDENIEETGNDLGAVENPSYSQEEHSRPQNHNTPNCKNVQSSACLEILAHQEDHNKDLGSCTATSNVENSNNANVSQLKCPQSNISEMNPTNSPISIATPDHSSENLEDVVTILSSDESNGCSISERNKNDDDGNSCDYLNEEDTPQKDQRLSFSDEEQIIIPPKGIALNSSISPKDDRNISCIEILDDSSSDHYIESNDLTDVVDASSRIIHGKHSADDSSIEDTPKKGTLLLEPSSSAIITPIIGKSSRLSSLRSSQICNSADLNVTDYVNNLLSQHNLSSNNREDVQNNASNDDEVVPSLSQCSQNSLDADEELNYSSRFATPARTRTVGRFDSVIEEEEKSNDHPEELPVIRDQIVPNISVTPKPSLITKSSTNTSSSTSSKYIIKTENVTPMPNYESMETPLINQELQKVGIKPLKRARGTKLLKYIYESTHPLVGSVEALEKSDSDDDGRVIKRRRRNSGEVVDNVANSTNTCEGEVQPVLSKDIVGDCLLENEKLEDFILERKRAVRIPSCQVPLQVVWHNFLSCNPNIKENILLYEPLQLESLHLMLKDLGFKFHVQDLLTFLDKKCITIRTAQRQWKRHR